MQFYDWIGVELDPVSKREKLISAVGGFVAMLLVVGASQHLFHIAGSAMLIASMGASAVLLFAVPHGQLSQPWPVIAGHGVSAFMGVLCARFIPDLPLAAGCAVGLAIGAMHVLKCIHPPGGASALTAVIGGPAVAAMGFRFVLTPVLINAVTIVLVAVLFNYLFAWRRYPAAFNKRVTPPRGAVPISHEQVVNALRELDSFVDITEDDLIRLSQILVKQKDSRSAAIQVASVKNTS